MSVATYADKTDKMIADRFMQAILTALTALLASGAFTWQLVSLYKLTDTADDRLLWLGAFGVFSTLLAASLAMLATMWRLSARVGSDVQAAAITESPQPDRQAA